MSDAGGVTTTTTTTSDSALQHRTADDSTVPTDLTVSSEGGGRERGSPAAGATAHRARLMHELELLRVELAELTHQRQVSGETQTRLFRPNLTPNLAAPPYVCIVN